MVRLNEFHHHVFKREENFKINVIIFDTSYCLLAKLLLVIRNYLNNKKNNMLKR